MESSGAARRRGGAAVHSGVAPDILIIRLSSIGDILLTTPLLRGLRERHPEARITYVTSARFVSLLEHNPRITRVVGWERETGLRGLGAAVRQSGGAAGAARGGGFTHRLDLQDSLRTRALRWQVGGRWRTYPKHRVARAAMIRWKRDWYRDRRPVAERYFDAAGDLGVSPDDGSLEIFLPRSATEAADALLRESPAASQQLIAIAPGASRFTKRWPMHHWTALTRRLAEQGNTVVVIGGTMDREAAGEIAASANGPAISAAGLDLPSTAALLKRCRALIAGDTGQMHLATAVGTPVLALFGPTVEAFGFFPYHAKAAVLQADLPCRPCSSHGSSACPLRHHRCLQDLRPAEVLAALRKLPR
ncbi:MAG TPA: glycosyltransferase family 9 protein [Gemmatimonadales bacterium]|nr:glycosyltransferase family 9 protein [Gemmatimonadales bacterium]